MKSNQRLEKLADINEVQVIGDKDEEIEIV
jgi:hypothetical protein